MGNNSSKSKESNIFRELTIYKTEGNVKSISKSYKGDDHSNVLSKYEDILDPEYISLTRYKDVRSIFLNNLSTVKKILISNNDKLRTIIIQGDYNNLETISIKNNSEPLTIIFPKCLPALKKLIIKKNSSIFFTMERYDNNFFSCDMPYIKEIRINSCYMTNIFITSKLNRLEKLDLSGNFLDDFIINVKLPSIKYINLANNFLTKLDLISYNSLKRINLSNNVLQTFNFVTEYSNLVELDISKNNNLMNCFISINKENFKMLKIDDVSQLIKECKETIDFLRQQYDFVIVFTK